MERGLYHKQVLLPLRWALRVFGTAYGQRAPLEHVPICALQCLAGTRAKHGEEAPPQAVYIRPATFGSMQH